LGFIDGSVLAIAMPAIRVNLGASLAEAQWISNAYALTLSALLAMPWPLTTPVSLSVDVESSTIARSLGPSASSAATKSGSLRS
ncbi:MFS transporter, partial [Mesorhizobium sp. M2D.F.Ca.ET.160.01.1.1]